MNYNDKERARNPFRRLPALGAIVMLGIVTVLGSGGSDSDPDDGNIGGVGDPPVPDVTVDGGVAKGIANMADVIAEELDETGAVLLEVGTAVTDVNGRYSIDLRDDYEGGPILITLRSTAATELKCDIPSGCGIRIDAIADTDSTIDFGEWYRVGVNNLRLTAMIPEAEQDETVAAAVTPYTDLAARNALDSAVLDAAAVYAANSEISQLLGGIDILNTLPIDITNPDAVADASATEVVYAALTAAVGSLADQTPGRPDWIALLQMLQDSIIGGLIMADDDGSPVDASRISVQEIIDAAAAVFAAAGAGDTSGTLVVMQSAVDDATDSDGDGFPDIDPAPSASAGSPGLTRVKVFVSDLRTWGNVIREETDSAAGAFDAEIALAKDAASLSFDFLRSGALRASIDAIVAHIDGTNTSGDLSDYNLGFSSGTIGVADGVYTIGGGVIDGVTVDMEASIPVEGLADSVTIGITSASFASAAFDAEILAGTIVLDFDPAYQVDYEAIDLGTADVPFVSGLELDIDLAFTQKQDAQGGDLTAAVSFAGNFSMAIVITLDQLGEFVWATPSTIAFGGNIESAAGSSIAASFTLNIANAASFEPFDAPELVLDGLGELEGSGDGEWLEAELGVTFALELTGLPEAIINVTIDRTAFDDAASTIRISYGTRQIVLSETLLDDIDLTITNQDGVEMVLDLSEGATGLVEGTISHGGDDYGTVEELPNGLWRFSYSDGSFEIF